MGPATAPLEVSVALTKAEQTAALAERRRRREEAREERAARKASWETRHKEWLARQAEWDERQRLRGERRAAARERVAVHVKGAPRGLDAEKMAKIGLARTYEESGWCACTCVRFQRLGA